MRTPTLTVFTTLGLLLAAPAASAAEGDFQFDVHGYYLIDFIVFIGAIWYFTKGPARRFLQERHDNVAKEMEAATALEAQAEERLRDYEQRLQDLDREIAQMREDFQRDGERDRDRILTEAKRASERIRKDTQATVAHEIAQLEHHLERDMVQRALELAEDKVRERMNAERHKELVRGFIDDLEHRRELGGVSAEAR